MKTTSQLVGEKIPLKKLPNPVYASAHVMWTNLDCSGDSMWIAFNAYDQDGGLIETVTDSNATITDPWPDSMWRWVSLGGSFPMPEGAISGSIVLGASPEATQTGIVWFDEVEIPGLPKRKSWRRAVSRIRRWFK